MEELWNQALYGVQNELSDHAFNTWIRPLHVRSAENDCFLVEAPNKFFRDRVEGAYAGLIRSKLRLVSRSETADISFVVSEAKPKEPFPLRELSRAKKEITKQEPEAALPDGLSQKYTFASFVVGQSSQFAHAAAQAVAQNPAQTYNPLFLYGGVGLGKTHLLCAIGNEAARLRPGSRVVYRTAERFMNEFINTIRYEKTLEFRTRFRETCDILLIDDAQFFGGKERTQEEFFHTFNTLYEAGKQIVLTSDKFPKEIPGLDERLRSRFEMGLLCDIQPPDVETRVAILKKKAEVDRVSLPDDVAFFLASQIKSNVRVLEGSLVRLAAFSSISGRSIDLDFAKEIFGSLRPDDRSVPIDLIQRRVAEFFNLNPSDLKSARRHRVVALPRQVAMYLSRKLTRASFPELGQQFGGKDHTTVMHAVSKIEKLLESDSPLRKTVENIEQTLHNEL